MEKFLERYSSKITGVLSTFDRMNFKGHILTFFQRSSRHYYLFQEKVLFKNFGTYAKRVSEVIKDTANNLAIKEGRPRVYLNSSRDPKEGIARKIMKEDKIQEGLICVLTCVEPCLAFDVRGNKENKKLEVALRERKCLFIYFYYHLYRVAIN